MAFTGAAVVKKVSDRLFRITGVSLAGDASGTIGFSDKDAAANVSIEAPTWQPYEVVGGSDVSLQDAVKVTINVVTDVGAAVPVSVTKAGTDHGDFSITLHNDNAGGGQVSGELEIYVEYH